MIWVAVILTILVSTHWAIRHLREWKALWLNILFTSLTLAMSIAVSTHVWANLHPIAILYAVFVPASHALYNLI